MKGWFGHFVEETEDSIHLDSHEVKMYKNKVVNNNVKNICLSMCDVKVSLPFTSLSSVLF
jgi:hypothetical protein